jgi:hypothetical protein
MSAPEVTPRLTAIETVRAPAQRWRWFAPALVVAWIVGMIDKVGVGVIAANSGFLKSMNLVGKPTEIGLLTTVMLARSRRAGSPCRNAAGPSPSGSAASTWAWRSPGSW